MAQKFKNPLAQALGLVLQNCRDKMGGISSSEIASELGLAASHYRMIEAGSAILQPARAIRVVQTFDTIEFVPLCQVLVAIQILDSTKQSIEEMRATADLLIQANPILSKILKDFDKIWEVMRQSESGQVAKTRDEGKPHHGLSNPRQLEGESMTFTMTDAEREIFLADSHVGIFGVSAPDRGLV